MRQADAVTRLGSFEAALDAINEAVIITGPDLDLPGPQIEYVNPAFSRMTGYAYGEAVGRTPRMLQGPLTDKSVLSRLRCDLNENDSFNGEVINYRKDGSTYIVEWVVSAVRDQGVLRYWVAALRDVTERRTLEDRNRLLIAELQDRVRNALAVIASLTKQTTATTAPDELGERLQSRIGGFSMTQGLITRDPSSGVDLRELVEVQLSGLKLDGDGRIAIAGPQLRLKRKAAEIIGSALHELTANAVAHGSLWHEKGQLSIAWSVSGGPDQFGILGFNWIEAGPLQTFTPTPKQGMGLKVIEQGLSYGLNASTTLAFGPDRFSCIISIPLDGANVLSDP